MPLVCMELWVMRLKVRIQQWDRAAGVDRSLKFPTLDKENHKSLKLQGPDFLL